MQNQFLPVESTTETTTHNVAPSVMPETSETAEIRASAQAIAEMLAQMQRKVRRRKNRFWAAFILFEASLLFLPFWALLHHLPTTGNSVLLLLIPTLLAVGLMFLLMFLPFTLDTETLVRLGGTKAVPTLLDSLSGNTSSRHRKSVLRTLTLLLPQMQVTEAHLLTPLHRYTLNVFLRQSRLPSWLAGAESSFAMAILKAYEQIGDAKAIPIVERLANSRPRNERQRAVQQAAKECLPLLQVHVSGVNVTQTLLRASMPETNTPETLLRAATATNASPQDLLRATTPTDTPPTS